MRGFSNVDTHSSDNPRKDTSQILYSYSTRSVANVAPTAVAKDIVTELRRREKAQRKYLIKYPNYNVNLFLFRPLDLF
jgi:hypothetical protein